MCRNTDSTEAAAATAAETATTTDNNNNGTTASDDNAGHVLTTSAFPPLHTVALIGLLLAHFIAVLPASLASMDAHKHVFLHVNFPHLLDSQQVGWIRLFLGSVMIVDTVYAFLYGKWEQDTEYYYP